MNQSQIEKLMHPKHIKSDLQENLQTDFAEYFSKAVSGLRKWLAIQEWESKNIRKEYVSYLDLHDLVGDIITTITMHAQKPMPFISIASMCGIAGMDKLDSLKTVCEIIATLEPVGLYEIIKYKDGSRVISSNVEIDTDLTNRINLYCYLPPLVERPDVLEHNKSSGYKTIASDSLILGFKENYHDKCISLDVLNKLNRNTYELDEDFINNFTKDWYRKELSVNEMLAAFETAQLNDFKGTYEDFVNQYQQDLVNWDSYKEQFNVLKEHLLGKDIYFTHKVDKRGRVYTQGFHFNIMGTSFEKACINLKHKETVYGEL